MVAQLFSVVILADTFWAELCMQPMMQNTDLDCAAMLNCVLIRRSLPDLGSTTPTGTQVDVAKVSQLVRQAVEAVRTRPTCLHQVRDTTRSVWRDGSNAVYAH